jgi:leader peptidase (prepilin peptidase) / N-methyltransferase
MQTTLAMWSQLFQSSPALWMTVVFILSLLIGSFLNVVIHRVPIMLDRAWRAGAQEILGQKPMATEQIKDPTAPFNLLAPRSACPKCGAMITAARNVPVVSYLLLRGRCANCRAPISPRYPLVELITAIASAVVAWKYGFGWQAAAALVFTWMLVGLSLIDFDHQLLPDNMTLPLLWMGLLLSLAGSSPGNAPEYAIPVDPRSSILGAVAGYLSLWSVYQAFKLLTGKEGMGYGDFKLLAALGAWMGWQMLLPIILLSAFTGAVVGIALIVVRGRDRNIPIPFGPYLAAAGWIALLWGPELVDGYLRMSKLR